MRRMMNRFFSNLAAGTVSLIPQAVTAYSFGKEAEKLKMENPGSEIKIETTYFLDIGPTQRLRVIPGSQEEESRNISKP